jgi:hypothetical protein
VVARVGERPSFRSVANAIRTGIFIEKIYRGMSSGHHMEIPPEVAAHLKVGTNQFACLMKDKFRLLEIIFPSTNVICSHNSVSACKSTPGLTQSSFSAGQLLDV